MSSGVGGLKTILKHARVHARVGEDDGYLVTFTTDVESEKSEVVVYNARTMSAEPVARIILPQHVPAGFHSLHVNEAQFKSRRPTDAEVLAGHV
jgi:hypothetical protein